MSTRTTQTATKKAAAKATAPTEASKTAAAPARPRPLVGQVVTLEIDGAQTHALIVELEGDAGRVVPLALVGQTVAVTIDSKGKAKQ